MYLQEEIMTDTKTLVGAVAIIAIAGILIGGLAYMREIPEAQEFTATEPARDRLIWINAIEIKGATNADELGAPGSDPGDVGDAFGFKWLEEGVRWQVASYIFTPGSIVVNEDDRVTLRFFAVNGNIHDIYVDQYQPGERTLNRGRFMDIQFTANTPGTFEVVCTNHEPSMRSTLIVNPRVG